jgi:hypothetical protein
VKYFAVENSSVFLLEYVRPISLPPASFRM